MKNTLPDTFKELNLTQLKNYAKDEWAVNFSIEFDRIILFRIRNPRKALHQHAMQGSIPGRYLILFELKESVSDDISEQYKRLLLATGQSAKGDYSTIQDRNIERNRKMLIDDNFHRVYNTKPDYDFQYDWMFRVKDPYKGLPPGIKEEAGLFFVLYDSNKKDLQAADIQKKTIKENVFKRIGKNWFITYKGESTSLPDLERIRYIVYLLDNPLVTINVVDLHRAVKKENISEKIEEQSGAMKEQSGAMKNAGKERIKYEQLSEEELDKEGVSLTDLAIDELTHEEKDKFEEMGNDLLQKIKNAGENKNQPLKDQTKKELERFRNYLFNDYGIKTIVSPKGIKFVEMHRPGPEVEKARKNVTNQIRNALKDIEKEIPSLAQHLRKHIETGKGCIYRLDDNNEVDWHIIW